MGMTWLLEPEATGHSHSKGAESENAGAQLTFPSICLLKAGYFYLFLDNFIIVNNMSQSYPPCHSTQTPDTCPSSLHVLCMCVHECVYVHVCEYACMYVCMCIAPRVHFWLPSGMLILALTLHRSLAGNHSCCQITGAMAMSYPEDSISQHPTPP